MWIYNILQILVVWVYLPGLGTVPVHMPGPCYYYNEELGNRFGIHDDPNVMPSCPQADPTVK